MRKCLAQTILILVLTGGAVACLAASASGGFYKQTIANNTGSDANDLHLVFTVGNVGAPALVPKSKIKITPLGDENTQKRLKQKADTVPITPNSDGRRADFSQRSFGTIESGNTENEMADITYEGVKGSFIDPKRSMWTWNGNNIGAVTVEGPPFPAQASFLPGSGNTETAVVTLTNPLQDNVTLTFTGIALYRDNNLVNYNLDEFAQPTGYEVPNIPSTITLHPGESEILSFGNIDPSRYELFVATGTSSADPNVTFDMATADVSPVPEPGSMTLLALGTICMAGYSWHCRRKAESDVRKMAYLTPV